MSRIGEELREEFGDNRVTETSKGFAIYLPILDPLGRYIQVRVESIDGKLSVHDVGETLWVAEIFGTPLQVVESIAKYAGFELKDGLLIGDYKNPAAVSRLASAMVAAMWWHAVKHG